MELELDELTAGKLRGPGSTCMGALQNPPRVPRRDARCFFGGRQLATVKPRALTLRLGPLNLSEEEP